MDYGLRRCMSKANYLIRKLIYGVPLLFGVTLISFFLMVYFGPDQTYLLLGKNPTQADIDNIRHQLGYDLPIYIRYLNYLEEIISFDFGASSSTHESISSIFRRAIPVSIAVSVPGFLIGNIVGIVLALWAAAYRGCWQDKIIMMFSVTGMSISFLIVIIGFQIIFCSSNGLNWFPVQGWDVDSISSYFYYVTVPTISSSFVALGYNTRFYRAVLLEELNREHVRTARAYGCHPVRLYLKHVLMNSLLPILTRLIFTIPFVLIGGSLLIESFFGIPGMGGVTYNAITSGDLPILKAVVSVSAILYVLILTLTDLLYSVVDPRVSIS